MFFVVSTGRSGTMTIARLLSLMDHCVCLHEPSPELILESSAYRYGSLGHSEVKSILASSRSERVNGAVYCEANQTLSLVIPVLTDAFPAASFIWLIRNGLDVVASTYQKQWYSGHSENHDRYEDCPALEKAWIDGRIEGDRCGDMTALQWRGMERFERCCWYWSYVNRIIESDLKEYASDRFKRLLLEELDIKLAAIIRWMGLKAAVLPTAGTYNVAKRRPYHWTGWTDDQREVFDRWCGNLMDRFYPTWRTPSGGWKGVRYRQRSGMFARLSSNYRLVKCANALFAPNRNT